MSASKWCLYFVRAAWKGDVVMREEPLIPWVVCHTRCASAFKYKACSKLTRCLRCLRNPGPGLLVLAGTEWPFLPREMHQKSGLPCWAPVLRQTAAFLASTKSPHSSGIRQPMHVLSRRQLPFATGISPASCRAAAAPVSRLLLARPVFRHAVAACTYVRCATTRHAAPW